jgi:hypothetical protein
LPLFGGLTVADYKTVRANWIFAYITPLVVAYDMAVVYRDALRHSCKGCGKIREPGERFSVRGKCLDCGNGRMLANARELRARSGPSFEHWYEEMRLRFEHRRVDDLQNDE